MYDFNEQYEKGKPFEEMAFDYLKQRNQEPYFNEDENEKFDIGCNRGKFEVKTCFHKNYDFPFEVQSVYYKSGKGVKGWSYTTESNFLWFYKPAYREFYVFDTQKALHIFIERLLQAKIFIPAHNDDYVTISLLINLEYLKPSLLYSESFLVH